MTRATISTLSVGLLGSALVSGCGLGDLVFDRDESESASTASGGAMLGCITSPSSNGGASGSNEDCANGLDCVRVPKDWSGPGAFYEGDPATVPCCPSAFPNLGPEGGNKPRSDAVTCASCSCEADVSCKPGILTAFLDKTCNEPLLPMPQDAECRLVGSVLPLGGSFSAAPPTFTVGATCKSVGGGVSSRPRPSWTVADRICAAPTSNAGCQGGSVCARPPTDLFVNAVCIWHAGLLDCPHGFPQQHAFFSDFDDTRTCSDCTCGQPKSGGSCSVTTRFYSEQGCSGGNRIGEIANPMSCFQKNGAVAYDAEISVTGPDCPLNGNTPTGSLATKPGTETTVCCTP